jgi:hypothetical protein
MATRCEPTTSTATNLPKRAAVRLPAGHGVHGSNQYRRVSLDAFFEEQRARIGETLDAHVARARARLRECEDDGDEF